MNIGALLLALFTSLILFMWIKKYKYHLSNKKPVTYSAVTNQQVSISNHKSLFDISWQFINDISTIIINKFSLEDQQKILHLGNILLNQGMIYQHKVNFKSHLPMNKINSKEIISKSSKFNL